ncbi:hypothetical protein N7468_005790 [Penicillium chermesinum]|uniref:Enoyl reductase (ER) domain-containing protein n=1 Tax=Penicillium chermesinum TaxID=63820 RepID=A0A9W9NZP5_9EURO|nr:uncharacterized protein N7468_005790 [Penicillium chermesinum]KAJ5232834.1 hypothetical protein N7468_005790 [Penicillium chermesinum]
MPLSEGLLAPLTMRAWTRSQRGPARKVLELTTGLPTPGIPTGSSEDVLIRVSHVALQSNSQMFMDVIPGLPFTGPWVPEIELAGEVVAAGAGAPAELRDPGTHVVGFTKVPRDLLLGHGVLAEYVRISGSQLARIDPSVDLAPASGINGCGSTALKMIRAVGVREGHTVLVNGASGSVGAVLVQLCKLRGARVVGVASGGNEALVRSFGVDDFIDYRAHDSLPAYLAQQYGDKPFDYVLDCVGTQALFANSPMYLKDTGALSLDTILQLLTQSMATHIAGGVSRKYIMFSALPNREDAIYLVRLLEEDKITIPVDSIFDMEDAVHAYERIVTKRARGKVVIKVHGS